MFKVNDKDNQNFEHISHLLLFLLLTITTFPVCALNNKCLKEQYGKITFLKKS